MKQIDIQLRAVFIAIVFAVLALCDLALPGLLLMRIRSKT
jgi:hypothetical protein